MIFSIRDGNIELRSCNSMLLLDNPHITAEIVQWEQNGIENFCFTLAYFNKDKEEFDLHFVGPRPFSEMVDRDTFWNLAQTGQDILDKWAGIIKDEEA